MKEWIAVRLSFLGLTLAIFFTLYFPAISRYSVNTLFNEKRGYFNFLFSNLQLRKRTPNGGIKLFGIILFVCYVLRVVSRSFGLFYEEQAKEDFQKIITNEKFEGEDIEWIRFLADKVVSGFVSFFSSFCDLFIDLWGVISINLTREIGSSVMAKALFCLVLVVVYNILIVRNVVNEKEVAEEKPRLLSIIAKVLKQLTHLETGNTFTIFYFLCFSNSNEIINAVLLGFNVGSLLGKLGRFIEIVPQAISTYEMGTETRGIRKRLLYIDQSKLL